MTERNEDLFRQRVAKAERLRALGVDPYPPRATRTHTNADALVLFERIESEPPGGGPRAPATGELSVAGRIRLKRDMGKKVSFLDLHDESGRLQIYCRQDILGERQFAIVAELDLGDIVGVTGTLFRTRTGEVTLEAHHIDVLTKALLPPPEKWHGVTDTEIRYRQRYLDLMSNDETRLRFRRRSEIVAAIRRYMDGRGFIEVETPVMQTDAGGAAAKPFTTFYSALGEERYLRIALELHLKRLLVGGFEKVYEIGRIFRNEGLDTKHNPEFTMLESYEAYADYLQVAAMVESLVTTVAREVLGTLHVPYAELTLDLTPPWRRATMRELLVQYAGLDFEQFRDEERLRGWMAEQHLHAAPELGWGKLIDEVFSERVQPHLMQPTFVLDYPIELSPLAKRKPDDPGLVERFEAFLGAFEIANAYTELNDPIDQRERFERQIAERNRGDEETELLDEDFLTAIEHGMPPAGGLGVGIDRLLMVLLNEPTIREVILFPQLRSRDERRQQQ